MSFFIKSDISGDMWQVAPESKIQLVSYDLSSKSLLGIYALEGICAIDEYIFCWLLLYVLISNAFIFFCWPIHTSFRVYCVPVKYLIQDSSFGQLVMKWSSYPHLKHVFCFRQLFSLCFLLQLHGLKDGFSYLFSFICFLNRFSVGCDPPQWLRLDWEKILSHYFLPNN